ncbi:MAG: RHS repeat-associated core domain-containing protein [Gemmatimonadetes bacterium]|nr:RHS repeat-associated core domain-containing protein [Gemmatimonadota bacterium]
MHQRFTPYGALLARDSAGSSMPRGLHVGWTGREHDAETGFSFHRARYYSADLRRWTQEDPIGYAGGANLYAYVGGAVMEARDPSGLMEDLSGRGLGFAETNRRAAEPPILLPPRPALSQCSIPAQKPPRSSSAPSSAAPPPNAWSWRWK